jgi:NADPH:quinone reductase-like Zn-dependent oxidoreductase
MATSTLLVRKDDLAQTRLRTTDDEPLADGQVRVAVDLLALTANNITYAAFGDAMDYWRFFPAGEEGWGIVPAWGFADVVQSLHPGVAVGERLYGYWPLATSAILAPDRLSAAGFRDAAPHRAQLHAIYNEYLRTSADPLYTRDTEAAQALLRPLFTTSWLIDDFLADNGFFGAKRLLLSSASSKTSYAAAHFLHQREGIEVIGLTSPGNRAFCESLGCYTRVLAYDELAQVDAAGAIVYVDFAGNGELRRTIHERFGQLAYSCAVGGTHVDQLAGGRGLPGPRPTLFFAPAQAKKRAQDWGGAALRDKLAAAWAEFLPRATQGSTPWLRPRVHAGADAVRDAFALVLGGRGDPREGHVLRLR